MSECQKQGRGGGTLPGTRSNRQKAVVGAETFVLECIAEGFEIEEESGLIYAFKNPLAVMWQFCWCHQLPSNVSIGSRAVPP